MGQWTDWQRLDGVPEVQSAPALAAANRNHMLCMVRSSDNTPFWCAWTSRGGWDVRWTRSLGGTLQFAPAITAYGADRYLAFHTGSRQTLYRRAWDASAGWERSWRALRTDLAWGAPAVASRGGRGSAVPQPVDVVVRNSANRLGHLHWDGSQWGDVRYLPPTVAGQPALASWGSGRLDLFARTARENGLLHLSHLNGSWERTGRDLTAGESLTAGPAAAAWGQGRLDVFARGGEYQVIHRYFDGAAWSDWGDLGGADEGTADNVAVTSRAPGNLELVMRGRDNRLWWRTYTADSDEIGGGGGEAADVTDSGTPG
ncbi:MULTISPECIES: hypothetical protein [Streptomyces]|uniref:hypothetical protein n=1 Tax=Streptomyces TaxID=1883 RepID=UPI002248FF17|nr:hypothetical protein [Streptomyces sp. JHD 1]MCX2970711.1 hypothetical protein [Streptomyces sp. JHD 1]